MRDRAGRQERHVEQWVAELSRKHSPVEEAAIGREEEAILADEPNLADVRAAWSREAQDEDVPAARHIAYARIVDSMLREETGEGLQRPEPGVEYRSLPQRLTVDDLRADIQRRVRSQELPLLENRDPRQLEQELEDADDRGFVPARPNDARALRALSEDGEEIKWTISKEGELRFGPSHVTHAAIARGEPVVAAGQACLFEMPDRRFHVLRITNRSGHYKPPPAVLDVAEPLFAAHGLVVTPKARKVHE